jgi:hypothetical protein
MSGPPRKDGPYTRGEAQEKAPASEGGRYKGKVQ